MKIVKMRKYTLLIGTILLYITAWEIGAIEQVKEVPTHTEVDPGEDQLLMCKISDKKGICSWQKDNKVIMALWRVSISTRVPSCATQDGRSLLLRRRAISYQLALGD